MDKSTKIIATVGPAVSTQKIMEDLLKAEVNVFRFNFSHGTHEEHLKKIRWAQELMERGYRVALFADLGGPKFRLGEIEGGNIVLKRGQEFVLTTRKIKGNSKGAYAPLEAVIPYVKKGDIVLLADGTVQLEVQEVKEDAIITVVRMGGEISSHKGINIPSRMSGISAITEKDVEDIKFAIKAGISIFALSFVGSEHDVMRAREVVKGACGGKSMIISKIERHDAVVNFDNILESSDAIMIARGDLAVETPYSRVPILQKEFITKAREKCKPVITATQMLRSILFNPLPSRAEISDIANAVIDGSDALMLSEETAVASDPVHSVRVMKKVIVETERFLSKKTLIQPGGRAKDIGEQIASSAVEIACSLGAKLIITPTASGTTAMRISSRRPTAPIVAPTPCEVVYEFLNLCYGVYPIKVDVMDNFDDLINVVKATIFEKKLAKEGDLAVITAGYPFGKPYTTNMVKVERL